MPEPGYSYKSAYRANEGDVPEVGGRQWGQLGAEQSVAKPKENWFRRWWNEGKDRRNSPRESLSWIIAYFFSGGPPKGHEIQNISFGGTFVYTDERWYKGTIVRMTLSDRREPVNPRSITVNAMVDRLASDGIGFQFIFVGKKKRRRGEPPPDIGPLVDVTETQFEEFLHSIRTAAE